MSLNNAKVISMGILFGDTKKNSLIVPLKITQDEKSTTTLSMMNINRALYLLFAENLSRYTIIFDKKSESILDLLLIAYFTSQQKNFLQNTQNILKRLNLILSDNNFNAKINSPQEFLDQVRDRLPKNIVEVSPQIFKITTTKETFYQTLAKFSMKDSFDKRAFFSFLKDFIVILPEGQVNLDINNTKKRIKDKLQYVSEIAITVNLRDSDLKKLQTKQKQLKSLLRLFSTTGQDQTERLIYIVNKNEYQVNYGKIIFNQGWDFVSANHENILDFTTMLEILSIELQNK